MVLTPHCAALFLATVIAATTPVPWQFQVRFPSELDSTNPPSNVPGTTMVLMKYEAVASPDVQEARVKTVTAAAGRTERSNTPPDVLSGKDLNEAHIKTKLSNILRDLGVGTGSPEQELARSKILIHILENLRAGGLASQLTDLFRKGTTEGGTPQDEDGGRQEKGNGKDEEEVADSDIDDQGKALTLKHPL